VVLEILNIFGEDVFLFFNKSVDFFLSLMQNKNAHTFFFSLTQSINQSLNQYHYFI